jgi:ribose 5-phosphate isomerase A
MISDAIATESAIDQITGVVTVGLFARRPADLLIVGNARGVERI